MNIAEGYGLIAKTQLLGTGDAVVRAYFHAAARRLLFVLDYTDAEGKKQSVVMGPMERRHLGSIIQTMRDVNEMQIPFYISE